jgi:hypothetical protein
LEARFEGNSRARLPSRRCQPPLRFFGIQQERTLGDIEAELVETDYHVAQNEMFAAHLNAIAGRVLSQFPREQAQVHVILIDSPAAQEGSVETWTAGVS